MTHWQVFTFWMPVLMLCAAMVVALHSFEGDLSAQMFVVTMTLNFVRYLDASHR